MRKKTILKRIGKKNWSDFKMFMYGQTVGMYKDGEINYYACDVSAFMDIIKNGYNRQLDPMAWD